MRHSNLFLILALACLGLASFSSGQITSLPPSVLQWSFEDDTDGWILGRSNGAAWQRREINFEGVPTPVSSYALEVIPTDVYSGTVLAMSPRLVVGDSGTVVVFAEFYMNASSEYPAYLKIRRRLSYETFDREPLLNLDAFGNQINEQWSIYLSTVSDLTPGEEFNLVLEGGLGIDNENNIIAVNRILVEGVTEIPYEEELFFIFSDGLVGWQAGSMDGGKWIVTPYADVDQSLNIPAPSTNDILLVDRFDIHSGVISIESPPLTIEPNTAKRINMRFWVRGSVDYPVFLRMNLKTLNGTYDEVPFLDLRAYGDENMLLWNVLDSSHPIPAEPRSEFFQIVIEADLGADINNMAAIESILIFTEDATS